MREILSQRGFTADEITTLEAREDYGEVRERVERLQADQLLDELQARTEARVEAAEGDLDARWESFKTDILAITEIEEDPQTHPETLEEVRTRLETEAQENISQVIQQRVSSIPLIGPAIAEWLTGQTTELISQDSEEERWIMWGIQRWIMLLVAWMFGLNSAIEQFEWAVNSARNAEMPEVEIPEIAEGSNIEINPDDSELLMYTWGVDLIIMLSENDNATTRTLFWDRRIKESTFSTIISEDFTIEETPGENVIALQETLRSQESLIDSILWSENQDWRELTLLEIFKEIWVYGQSLASLDNLNPEEILSGDFSIWSLTLWDWWAIGWTLGTLFERYSSSENSVFHWVNKGLFGILITENSKKITDDDVEGLFANNSFENTEEYPWNEEFEQAFVEFWRWFINVIATDFYLWPPEHREEFESFIRGRSLTYSEVLEFMILTWGSLDASSYNDAAKTIIYTKIWLILGEWENWNNSIRSDTYNHAFRNFTENGITEWIENIPPQVFIIWKRLIWTIRNNIEWYARQVWTLLLEWWRFIGLEGQLIVAASSAAILLALFKSRLFLAKATSLTMWLQVGIIWTIIFMGNRAFANPEFQNEHPEIWSEEELINLMITEVQGNGIDLSDGLEQFRTWEWWFDYTGETQTWYRRFIFHPEILENDWMEIIQAEWDIYSQTHWNLTIQKNRSTLNITFLVNWESWNTYFKNEWGVLERISDNVLENSVFVRDSSDIVYLAVYRAGGLNADSYVYISLQQLEEDIQNNNGNDILVAENLYLRYDLMISSNTQN